MKMVHNAKATSLLPPNHGRDRAIEAIHIDAELKGKACRAFICQGPPVCAVTSPSASFQEICPYCRCDTYDPKTGWTTTDPLETHIQ